MTVIITKWYHAMSNHTALSSMAELREARRMAKALDQNAREGDNFPHGYGSYYAMLKEVSMSIHHEWQVKLDIVRGIMTRESCDIFDWIKADYEAMINEE